MTGCRSKYLSQFDYLIKDDNPVDKQAVVFQCQQDEAGGWTVPLVMLL